MAGHDTGAPLPDLLGTGSARQNSISRRSRKGSPSRYPSRGPRRRASPGSPPASRGARRARPRASAGRDRPDHRASGPRGRRASGATLEHPVEVGRRKRRAIEAPHGGDAAHGLAGGAGSATPGRPARVRRRSTRVTRALAHHGDRGPALVTAAGRTLSRGAGTLPSPTERGRIGEEVERRQGQRLRAATMAARASGEARARRSPASGRGLRRASADVRVDRGDRLAHVAGVRRAVSRLAVVGVHRELDAGEVPPEELRHRPLGLSGSWMRVEGHLDTTPGGGGGALGRRLEAPPHFLEVVLVGRAEIEVRRRCTRG